MKCVEHEMVAAVHHCAVMSSPQYSVYTKSCSCTSLCCKEQSTVQCVHKQKHKNKDGHITFNIVLLFAGYKVKYIILYSEIFLDVKLTSVSSYEI